MECTTRTTGSGRLSCCLLLVGVFLLSSSPGSAAASRRLLQTSEAQDYTVSQAHLRACNNLRPLKWSDTLAEQAAQWAQQYKDNCAAASPAPGINVFLGYAGGSWLPSDAVAAWASEKDYYDFLSNSCAQGKQCGHFTQLVWKDTKEVGCATMDCASGEKLMTCHYSPRGNVEGQKPF
ncbi:hypothetical protein ACP70R_026083 [Stipagrostis hirtigluma subsp. patula]